MNIKIYLFSVFKANFYKAKRQIMQRSGKNRKRADKKKRESSF